MNGFFGFFKFIAALYIATHALLYASLHLFGPVVTGWLLFFLIPIIICNVVVGMVAAQGTNERLARQRKRRAWRGY